MENWENKTCGNCGYVRRDGQELEKTAKCSRCGADTCPGCMEQPNLPPEITGCRPCICKQVRVALNQAAR